MLDRHQYAFDGWLSNGRYLTENHPNIKIMALSVEDNEESIIKMLRFGAKGYLLKDTDSFLFKKALEEVSSKGYYHSELVSNTLLKSINTPNKAAPKVNYTFQAREQEFLLLACTEYTHKEIADKMCISPRTVDGYRESLFEKLEVKSRIGMVLFAIKKGLVVI